MDEMQPRFFNPKVVTLETNTPVSMQTPRTACANSSHELSSSPDGSPLGVGYPDTHQTITFLASDSIPAPTVSRSQAEMSISSACADTSNNGTPKPKGRKGHTKSRRGCLNCKKARIKVFVTSSTLT